MCLRAAYKALPVAERSFSCIFSFAPASGTVAAEVELGASWCFSPTDGEMWVRADLLRPLDSLLIEEHQVIFGQRLAR